MKKFSLLFLFLFCVNICFSQTVVHRSHKIKNTLIEWTVIDSDTIYSYPIVDFTSPLKESFFLLFRGSNALMSTLEYLSTANIGTEDMIQLDNTVDKNIICRAAKGFATGYLVFNKKGEYPQSLFWMKKFVKDDYKQCLKYFSNGK